MIDSPITSISSAERAQPVAVAQLPRPGPRPARYAGVEQPADVRHSSPGPAEGVAGRELGCYDLAMPVYDGGQAVGNGREREYS